MEKTRNPQMSEGGGFGEGGAGEGGFGGGQADSCPVCGMPRKQWKGHGGRGAVDKRGKQVCCQGCADGSGCTCEPAKP